RLRLPRLRLSFERTFRCAILPTLTSTQPPTAADPPPRIAYERNVTVGDEEG
ncbi:uncharacterized protein STEHIDRAFT_171840, partial [Stereum hirsutum FP-91666 SS1]|uniref:uncharacterized protein n=1 Tax=Stereum hirsutum (strain FP-91666) TaxID=721885 RepID=UPI000444A164